jgi:hypothetical protein
MVNRRQGGDSSTSSTPIDTSCFNSCLRYAANVNGPRELNHGGRARPLKAEQQGIGGEATMGTTDK